MSDTVASRAHAIAREILATGDTPAATSAIGWIVYAISADMSYTAFISQEH
jgi:hypothetical protein